MSAVRKFNGETADGRTLVVKSVGGQPVNLAARLDLGPAKDGSVDALLTPSSTSYVAQVSHEFCWAEIGILENCVRMTSLPKIREPKSCSPHRVLILRTMFSSNPQGVVEMAEVVVVVAQNVEDRAVVSPPEWILISLIFRCRVWSSLRLTHVRTMLIVPSVISSLTPLPHHSSMDMFEAHLVYSPTQIPSMMPDRYLPTARYVRWVISWNAK